MKTNALVALLLSLALALAPALSDARRLGGGKSSGLQRNMPARTAPAAPQPPAAPAQAAPTAPQGATPAAAPRRNWMGPLAGLAAGLGLAALFGQLGVGGAAGSLLTLALLALAGVLAVRVLMARSGGARQPALVGATPGGGSPRVAWPPASPVPSPVPVPHAAPAGSAPPAAFVPASFDSDGFARIARTLFIRLQAVNDAGDLDDLRRFTTPEMFAELRVDLLDRGNQVQRTDVLQVDTQVLDLADDGQRQIVSVRFHGQVREEVGAAAVDFDEVWHLARPHGGAGDWAIAGIEQLPA